jgi:hypothetical protein
MTTVPSELFFHHFPEIAKAETRSMTLAAADGGVPAGNYAFFESYCTEPGCDCRRVLIHVTADEGIVAVISYGFDRNAPMCGPFVDPINPRAPYADGMLRLMRDVVLADPDYVARLERHYRMMRAMVATTRPAVSPAARAESRKKKKKKDKKKRRPW